jgi:hypothetical protein
MAEAAEQASADLAEACDGAAQTISRKLISQAADTEEANLGSTLATDEQAAANMRNELAKLNGGSADVAGSSAARQKIADILDPKGDVPPEPSPYTGAGSLSADEQEAKDAADAAQAYERIRGANGDAQRISQNTGIDEGVLNRVKSHLFEQEHELPMPPDGHLVTQRFTPDKSISDLWEKADAGTLTGPEREQFQALMQHESVESSLMSQGLPYRSSDPGAWEDGINWPSAEHYGAHDLSPHAAYPNDPWRGWQSMGFGEPPTTPIARDLGNTDAVIAEIRERMGI